jgi:hypothetical protein
VEGWPAFEKWTFEWLGREHGALEVHLLKGRIDAARFFEFGPNTLGAYVDGILGGATAAGYLGNVDLGKLIPGLERDLAFPPLARPRLANHNYWIGPAGTVSQLHCDFSHNLFAQLRGKKHFALYSPERSRELRPARVAWYSAFSALDYGERDASELPAPDYEFVVERGDLLLLPYGWWHRVTSLEPSISVNRWWWSRRMIVTKGPRACVLAGNGLLGAAREAAAARWARGRHG